MNLVNHADMEKRMNLRLIMNRFANVVFFLATMLGLVVLGVLIVRVLTEGLAWINMDFLTGKLSTQPERAGIMGAILGTLWLMAVVAPVTMFFGVGTAIYLELYAKKNRFNSWLETNISNLAGVPSIVYGILGMTIFVRALDFGNIILAGGFTMALLILPIVIVASQEALRAVPGHLSEASYGMGATKWQTIRRIILPTALPGIMTGAILSLSRAIGETAPLVVIGIPALLIPFPGGIFDKFTVLPMQIYYWTLDSSLIDAYANLAAATIVTLLVILLLLNATAIMVRAKFQKQYD